MWALIFLLAAEPEFLRIEAASLVIDEINTARAGAFLIGRTEVTQAEYRRVTGRSPSQAKGDQLPVENVTWHEAVLYANRRSVLENLTICYDGAHLRLPRCNGYRLPTNAEWTLAATPAELTAAHLRTGSHDDPAALLHRQTRPVATGQPNPHGLHDLHGNVWEWCEDFYSPEPLLDAIRDPQGPAKGVERIVRGGSYLTSPTQWNKAFISSLAPDRRSPFTGFRVVRQLSPAAQVPPPNEAWLAQFQHEPSPGIPPVDPTQPGKIKTAWAQLLGLSPHQPRPPTIHILKQFRESTWSGQLLNLNTSRILVMEPVRKPAGRLPVVIVPYYDVDSPAGENLGGHRSGGGVRAFARLAVQRGFMAVAIRWFGEGDGEGYDEAVLNLARQHPGLTGLGQWITEAQSLVDYLVTRPDIDPSRIGIIGHSLGGKMALYAAAFDPRIAVVVSSEPGISLNFSNYEAFWYLGKNRPLQRDQQELLALIAPRPFLLIAGESSDGQKSWPYLQSAQPAYPNRQYLGMFNHRQGHTPTAQSVHHAMDWLEGFLSVQ